MSGIHDGTEPLTVCHPCNGYGVHGDEYVTRKCTNCDGLGKTPVVGGWRPSDGVTHNGQPVVPYQCFARDCTATFEQPCMHSPAGKIAYRDVPNRLSEDPDLQAGGRGMTQDEVTADYSFAALVSAATAFAQHVGFEGLLDKIHALEAAAIAYAKSVEPEARNPEHDSLFQRFEQLEYALDAAQRGYFGLKPLQDARDLLRLIRAQVLK